jgi:hypothetical protein
MGKPIKHTTTKEHNDIKAIIRERTKEVKLTPFELAVLSGKSIDSVTGYFYWTKKQDINLSFLLSLCKTLGLTIAFVPIGKPVNKNSIASRELLKEKLDPYLKKRRDYQSKKYEEKYGKPYGDPTKKRTYVRRKPTPFQLTAAGHAARRGINSKAEVSRAIQKENDFLRIDGDSD